MEFLVTVSYKVSKAYFDEIQPPYFSLFPLSSSSLDLSPSLIIPFYFHVVSLHIPCHRENRIFCFWVWSISLSIMDSCSIHLPATRNFILHGWRLTICEYMPIFPNLFMWWQVRCSFNDLALVKCVALIMGIRYL